MIRASLLLAAVLLVAADDPKAEEGFKPLFNGKDLSGWKTVGKKSESLEGKTEAFKGRFKVVEDRIVIDPKVKGDVRIETEKTFAGDVVIRFEFKPGPKCNNDLFIRGQKFDLAKGNVKNLKEGLWQKFEIAVKGDAIEFTCDGESQRKGKTKGKAGTTLAIRAEFGEMEIRRLRIRAAE